MYACNVRVVASYVFCAWRALSLVLSVATLIVFYALLVSRRGKKSTRRRKSHCLVHLRNLGTSREAKTSVCGS